MRPHRKSDVQVKAIILAGGFGTRLRPIIGDDTPKCMAPIMGKPMISFIINNMKKQGIEDITLALHYKPESFVKKFGHLRCVIEDMPLGTGGAIKNCIEGDEPVLVCNGDTITDIDYNDMLKHHIHPLTIAVTERGESAGIYIMDPEIFDDLPYPYPFSFEKDIIPHVPFSTYIIPWFTDYGTPEQYSKACKEWI